MSFETNGRISQLRKPIYLYVLYYPHLSPASSKKNFFFYQSQENKQGGRYWKWKGLRYETLDMSDILYDDNINSLNNESSKQEVEKKITMMMINCPMRSINHDDIGHDTNSKLVNIANKAFSRLIYGGKKYFQTTKGLSEGRGAQNQQKHLEAHESWFQEKQRWHKFKHA